MHSSGETSRCPKSRGCPSSAPTSGPGKSLQSLLSRVSSTEVPNSETCRFFQMLYYGEETGRNKIGVYGGGEGGALTAVSLSSLEVLQPSYFFSILAELAQLTPPTPLFLTLSVSLLPLLHPFPPPDSLPPPPPACLLTQTLNLLEPRDPVCYVNQLNADTHVNARTPKMYTPTHTGPCAGCRRTRARAHTHSVLYGQNLAWQLSWQVFNSLLSLTS